MKAAQQFHCLLDCLSYALRRDGSTMTDRCISACGILRLQPAMKLIMVLVQQLKLIKDIRDSMV